MRSAVFASLFVVLPIRWAGQRGSSVGGIAMGLFVSGCCNGDVLCVGGLNVQFSRAVALPYRVEARSLQDSLLASADCVQVTANCSATNVSLVGVRDQKLVLRVSEASLVSVDTISPLYQSLNKGCGSCFRGDATMRMANPQ